jgi:hypothetical protein
VRFPGTTRCVFAQINRHSGACIFHKQKGADVSETECGKHGDYPRSAPDRPFCALLPVERGLVDSEPVERCTPAEERAVELARASNTG